MSEDLYAMPDMTKKVRFRADKKADGPVEICDSCDNATIYDNYCAEELKPPNGEENRTQDQQQTVPQNIKSKERDLRGPAAVFLGILCLFLLITVVTLLVLLVQVEKSWTAERNQLYEEKVNLFTERTELLKNNTELKGLNANLTRKSEELQRLNDQHFKEGWVYFRSSFYHISFSKKTWRESRNDCLSRGADLMIIDSQEEQRKSDFSMSEDLYTTPDFTKKVRFRAEKKADGPVEICDSCDNATIYDNYCAEELKPPNGEENRTQDQQQTVPQNINSKERDLRGPAAVFLGILCLFLLITVVTLLVLLVQVEKGWTAERNQLYEEKVNLFTERTELLKNNTELKGLNANLTRKSEELQRQNDRLFQEGWVHFRSSFYYISSTEKTWQKSQDDCLSRGADLTIVDSREEQDFLRRLSKVMWIGLTDRAEERTWRWVDGTVLNTSYWSDRQPNNWRGKQDCAEVQTSDVENNWNDARCDSQNYWVCEKKVAP
ncbi:uncharacterized protein LOC115389786 [Salarias fasciatus]|uniref:uncharacterized protein LOC115389786 n=1 Tax=Salarias fasciatus TaxID=181472 RepID=UPI0011766682|nr:uncharacterized protein LOC115389786 [Salarias fasciatus]